MTSLYGPSMHQNLSRCPSGCPICQPLHPRVGRDLEQKESTSSLLTDHQHFFFSVMVRPTHYGKKRSLVFAFDIGTTYSGISYVLLDPGQTPEINSVTRYALPLTSTMIGKIPLNPFPQVPRADCERCQDPINNLVRFSRDGSLFWGRGRSFGNNR